LLAFEETFNYNKLVGTIQKVAPEGTKHLEMIENCPEDLSTVAIARSRELLEAAGGGFKSLEQSLRELFARET
jgi:hypothetical protein